MPCATPEHKAKLGKLWRKRRCLLCMVEMYEAALAVYADSKNWKISRDDLGRLRDFTADRAWWAFKYSDDMEFIGCQRSGFRIARQALEQFQTSTPNTFFLEGEQRRRRKLKNGSYPVTDRPPPRMIED